MIEQRVLHSRYQELLENQEAQLRNAPNNKSKLVKDANAALLEVSSQLQMNTQSIYTVMFV
jgi:hypothetical protein